ncbi:Hsp20 family protein [Halomarina oriensis]|uniref:Hsp20 family protein n=2 Tax=Halomarina oriensis TaxID=671145 RepID=A0A6B0GPQ3_9EURY|nr:Hsp20 family protein [Halomarina oriensis]
MDRMFDQMRRSMLSPWPGSVAEWDRPAMESWRNHSDSNMTVERREGGYVVLADLPGFEKEELDVRFDDGVLTVRGDHEVSEESEHGRSMRSRSVFEQVHVPGDVVEGDIAATYRNGVLEIDLPTTTEAEDDDAHRIDID